jgi:hypothetical protein
MNDPSISSVVAVTASALGGCLFLARMLDKHLPKSEPTIVENPDDLGYFLDMPATALRGLPNDGLPTCPDVIPEWMMEEHYGRSR